MARSHLQRLVNRVVRAGRATWTSLRSEPVAILSYHRVNRPTVSGNSLTVSTENFREQMGRLRTSFQPISLRQFRRGAWDRKGRRPVVVTFDDGYADTYLNAGPAMRDHGIPSTVFVTTGSVGEGGEFWWDELEELVFSRIQEAVLSRFRDALSEALGVALRSSERVPLYEEICSAFKGAPEGSLQNAMKLAREYAGTTPLSRPEYRAMTPEELREFSKNPQVEIGAHTVTHLSLGRSDPERQRREIRESKRALETLLQRPVHSLAYPFGTELDYSSDTQRIAKEEGIDTALTMVSALANPETSPFELPRVYVKDWNGAEFERRLKRFFWVG